jgi:hypothetical protein
VKLDKRLLWIWAAVWIATRFLMVAQVGFLDDVAGVKLEDVGTYETWSHILTTQHAFPGGPAWQYPPGAALVMLLPRLGPGGYGETFVALMLICDLAGLWLLARLGRRSGNYTGAWVWLLGIPLLGVLPILRFDLVPAVIAIAALLVIQRRPHWFGALVGLGAAIKVWPIVLLFGEWDRRRLLAGVLVALGTIACIFLVAAIAFGDPFGFISQQGSRGLQEEAVGTAPWQLRELISGEALPRVVRYGSWELYGSGPDAAATLMEWLSLASLAAAAIWWRFRARAIRAGRSDLADATVSRDFVFALVLALVVTSRVLSPQYMIWLLALAAVVLSSGGTRLARPAWIVVGATILSTSTFKSPANTLVRDLALVVASVDAAVAMIAVVRRPPAPELS